MQIVLRPSFEGKWVGNTTEVPIKLNEFGREDWNSLCGTWELEPTDWIKRMVLFYEDDKRVQEIVLVSNNGQIF